MDCGFKVKAFNSLYTNKRLFCIDDNEMHHHLKVRKDTGIQQLVFHKRAHINKRTTQCHSKQLSQRPVVPPIYCRLTTVLPVALRKRSRCGQTRVTCHTHLNSLQWEKYWKLVMSRLHLQSQLVRLKKNPTTQDCN